MLQMGKKAYGTSFMSEIASVCRPDAQDLRRELRAPKVK
jgi:hypothetical protein